jgi:hypothetical protein
MTRYWLPVLFATAPLAVGCSTPETAPAPPLDLAAPTATETATFALG